MKFNTTLEAQTAKDIVNHLMECALPLVCAHGRPTVLALDKRELMKWGCLFVILCVELTPRIILITHAHPQNMTLDSPNTKQRVVL